MILNGTTLLAWTPCRMRLHTGSTATATRVRFSGCGLKMKMMSTDKLRLELDQLHSEALTIRNKANSARLRLMRLSEAAERLRRQAGVSVQAGKENDARELLYQKKKVLEAMDKSKARIQLLDDLCFKLNEAISAKETHLIKNVATDLDTIKRDTSNTVRIVSPKDEEADPNVDEISVDNTQEFSSDEGFQTRGSQPDQPVCTSANSFMGDLAGSLPNESDVLTSLKGVLSYEDFIANIDEQLNRIELELETVLRVSALVLGGDEKLKNLRVQQTLDILEGVHHIRERISKIMQKVTI